MEEDEEKGGGLRVYMPKRETAGEGGDTARKRETVRVQSPGSILPRLAIIHLATPLCSLHTLPFSLSPSRSRSVSLPVSVPVRLCLLSLSRLRVSPFSPSPSILLLPFLPFLSRHPLRPPGLSVCLSLSPILRSTIFIPVAPLVIALVAVCRPILVSITIFGWKERNSSRSLSPCSRRRPRAELGTSSRRPRGSSRSPFPRGRFFGVRTEGASRRKGGPGESTCHGDMVTGVEINKYPEMRA